MTQEPLNNFCTSMNIGVSMGLRGMPGPPPQYLAVGSSSSQNRHPLPIQTNLPPTLTLDGNNKYNMSRGVSPVVHSRTGLSEGPLAGPLAPVRQTHWLN